jgi:hypothetical protein
MMYINDKIRSLPEPTSDIGLWARSVFGGGIHMLIFFYVVLLAPIPISSWFLGGEKYFFSEGVITGLLFFISSIFFFFIYKKALVRGETMAMICFVENPWNPNESGVGLFSALSFFMLGVAHMILAVACGLIWDVPPYYDLFSG